MRRTKEDAAKTRGGIIDAARKIFHQRGVARSSLETIAREAGVTRGAVYWHFKNKAELFLAMREKVFDTMLFRVNENLLSNQFPNPLDAIEAALNEFFKAFQEFSEVRECFEIMIFRCECVDELACIQEEIGRPAREFLINVESVYKNAAARKMLRKGLAPINAARDTWIFTNGLIYLLVSHQRETEVLAQVPEMIVDHVALRRAS